VAVNCWVVHWAMLGLVGVTSRETSTAGVIVRVVEPNMFPDAAVIVVVSTVTEVARPCEPAALLMSATFVAVDVQVTEFVRFCVVLSE